MRQGFLYISQNMTTLLACKHDMLVTVLLKLIIITYRYLANLFSIYVQ